ncbi:putative XS domain-containing protein [Helianthus annuus]|nr:putative XS domain-containing protein [Helianthus annuus]
MQSRRHEDFASQSSFDRRGRDMDIGPDGYIAMSPRSMRSWSPRRMEAAPAYSDRALAGRRSISLERRRAYDDSGRVIRSRSPAPAHSDRALAGRRSISLERRRAYDDSGRVIRSRSPPYMEAKRGRPFYKDDWVSDRDLPSPERRSRYEFFERMDRGREDVEYSPARNEFGYGHGSTRTGVRDVRDDKFEARRFDSGVRELPSQKSAVMGGLYKSTGDVGPISKPEPSGDLSSAPLNIGLGLSRSPAEKRESAQYLDTVSIHSRLGRKVTREDEMPYMGMAQVRETERRLDYDYDYNRGLSPGSHKERMKSFRGLLYERERKMEEHDLPSYDSSSRYLKRKGAMEDEEDRIHSRNMMSRLDAVYRRHNRDFRDEEWIDPDAGRSRFSERTQKVYDDDDFIYDPDEFVYYYDHDHDHDHGHHMRLHTYDDKHAKGYPRSSGRVGYNSYYPNRRNVLPRWKNDKDADMYSSATEQHEPHEDTKEFKQLVNDYFLSFTKKLNENSVVRRRYMEQGRGGSLYCIVCGRSLSKEFLDAQRLAMHAFMSRKGGLRAQHLGLLKALCVMFGWNSVLPSDTPRWFPETLSTTEASAQKQDLIIWPPVVIVHNISITSNNSNGEGPITVEALGQYLRGVGLSGGKVKLGKPANCSIMLVKFLGTFSGLQEAEKIHEYFLKKKHGRKYLEQTSSSKGKSNHEESAEKEAERVLFGYMGIAEDLDKVDIDTKRKCSIKSKKEIQDIADAPVKPGE